jgi:5-methylcytosine-specific restriction endonuclease McrA
VLIMADDEDTPTLPAIISRKDAIAKGLKWCWFHQRHEPVEDFGKSKGRPGGLQPLCRTAKAEQERAKRAARDGYKPYTPAHVRAAAPDEMKWCAHHGAYCHKEDFGADARKADGLQSSCRRGQAELDAVRRATPEMKARAAAYGAEWREINAARVRESKKSYYALNRERELARCAARYAANRDGLRDGWLAYYSANADRIKAYQAVYRSAPANKKKIAERDADYRETNKEKMAEYRARYYAINREQFRAYRRNRRARVRMAEGSHTADDIKEIYSLQKGKCACCRKKVGDRYHIDHIQPLSKGGSNWPNNLQLLCPPCNIRKSDRDPIDHMQSMGFLL